MIISSGDSFPMLTSTRQVGAAHKGLPPGATIRKIAGDGNCLFRALSLCIYGSQEQHTTLRNLIVSNVVQNWSHYSSYIIGDKSYGHPINSANDYKSHMSKNGAEGGHLELNVATRIFDVLIKVYNSKTSKVIVLGRSNLVEKKQIDLLYTGEGDKGHYDAIFLDGRKAIQNFDDKNINETIKKAELKNSLSKKDWDRSNIEIDLDSVHTEDSTSLSTPERIDSDTSSDKIPNASSESTRSKRKSTRRDVKSDKNVSSSSEMVSKKGHKKSGSCPLHLECFEEELSAAQQDRINKVTNEFNDACNTLNALVAKFDGEVFEKGDTTICQLKALLNLSPVPANPPSPITVITNQKVSPVAASTPLVNVRPQSALKQPSPAGYQFLVNQPVNVLVSPTAGSSPAPRQPVINVSNVSTPISLQSRSLVGRQPARPLITSTPSPPVNQIRSNILMKSLTSPNTPQTPSPLVQANEKVKFKTKPQSVPAPTNTVSSVTGPKSRKQQDGVVDLTSDDGKSQNQEPDSREMVFNKVSGKTFPSLVVVARPNLRSKEFPPSVVTQERKALDADVKNVLMCPAPKFCEWLIQQGLISSEQHCSVHVYPDMSPVKLKLGMYSDASKFPFSGGYVWISDCCPAKFVSVFSDSLFESSSTPTITLKLIYHWACQTSVSNVVQWVKVDNLYVKNFYTHMRAVCTAALHDKLTKIGGPRKRIEVGVISLGTTSADGHLRQVKVEVLGVLDPETKQIFLRAVEPTPDSEKNYKRRFSKILEHLETWVHKSSVILTDFTVDKGTLTSMGFNSVFQVSINDSANSTNKFSNYNIMEYLRRIVPRMFQNTLSLLSRNIIQQFLDELVWREMYGQTAARAYKSITQHIAEQTKLKISGETLLARLTKIAINPFKNWSSAAQLAAAAAAAAATTTTSTNNSNQVTLPVPAEKLMPPPPAPVLGIDALPTSITEIDPPEPPTKPENTGKRKKGSSGLGPQAKRPTIGPSSRVPKATPNVTLQPLNSYYYGTYQSNSEIISSQEKVNLNLACCVCKEVFDNNMKLMMHIIAHALHADSQRVPKNLDPICKYCLKSFSSQFNLDAHIDEAHVKNESEPRCLICVEKFKDRSSLILHMHRFHYELELPYECGFCYYRTSEHKKVIDHFYKEHDGTGKIMCPLCLKIILLKSGNRGMTRNLFFFFHHIQKHHRKSTARRCDRCELQFVHKGILKEHKDKDHVSYVGVPDVERYKSNVDSVMMPKPSAMSSKNIQRSFQQNIMEATGFKTYTVNKFLSLKLVDIPEEATCCECEGLISGNDHFEGKYSCIVCCYSTYCGKAMYEHSQVFHSLVAGTPKESFNIGTPIILPEAMHCVCGFSSRSGNKLTKHLAQCKRKSAYPSAERAAQNTVQSQSASFPPLVSLDDADAADPTDRWLRAFVTPNENAEKTPPPLKANLSEAPPMLNVLGLARRDPEQTSDDSNSKISDGKPDSTIDDVEINSNEYDKNKHLSKEESKVEQEASINHNNSGDVIELDDDSEVESMKDDGSFKKIKLNQNSTNKPANKEEINDVEVMDVDEQPEKKPNETNDLNSTVTDEKQTENCKINNNSENEVKSEVGDVKEKPSKEVEVNNTNLTIAIGNSTSKSETDTPNELDGSKSPSERNKISDLDIVEVDEVYSENHKTNNSSLIDVSKKSAKVSESSNLSIVDVKSYANNDINMLDLENGEKNDVNIIDFETNGFQNNVQTKKSTEIISNDEMNAAVESIREISS
nr:PREDICTED: uncharacterized protein LOC109029651 isoform X1 [Bemisia tabaci]XP_018895750.1 PREDICTED: uncharacterized protein LOC109029651 isoform X1 [Bemisia tabaci]